MIQLLGLLCLCGSVMEPFVADHVPMRVDGKIDIPKDITRVKLDIGLSYSAPMSQQWLSQENDLWVFAFEPNLSSVATLKAGAVKRDPLHGDPLDRQYVGTRFFVMPCALGLVSGEWLDFYETTDCGCSSLYPPKWPFEVAQVVPVPVFRLSDFFDVFPFDTHPVIDYIKIDAQGSDLDIVKGGGAALQERVVYITLEAEDIYYEHTCNSESEIDAYMTSIGFERDRSRNTADPTYFNPRFKDYVQQRGIKIFQRG